MKQDKHKAKRSARYKKQHGIGSGNKSSAGAASSESRHTNQQNSNSKAEEITNSSSVKHKDSATRENRGDDDGAASGKTKSFSRRKIESNWARYDDFDVGVEDDQTTTGGADFETLISQSGGASAQMRLKDEDWDKLNQEEEEDKETEFGDIFKVNFKKVADCMQAVPLHERLGVPKKYFEDDLLEHMNSDAAHHTARVQKMHEEVVEAAYLSRNKNTSLPSYVFPLDQDSICEKQTGSTEGEINAASFSKDSGTCISSINSGIEDLSIASKDGNFIHGSFMKQTDETSNSKQMHDTSDEKSHIGHQTESSIGTSTHKKSDVGKIQESSVNDLQPQVISTPSKDNKEEDLEDWLDDFLDDE